DVIHPDIKHIDRNFIRQFDVIIIDRHERTAFYEILQKKKSSTQIIIDPSTEVSPFTLDMIKHADYPIIPIEALVKIGNANNLSLCLASLRQITKKPVIITAGEFGSIIYDGKTIELIPSLQVKAVDVQGAGDIYRGAFTYGVIQGWSHIKSAEYANKIAALHCTKLGNAAAVPKSEEIAMLDNFIIQKTQITVPKIHEYFFRRGETL
ncbi:MAG: carbohydrate kinase family protein, partial [Candidatus Levyibacteriota bacterium]